MSDDTTRPRHDPESGDAEVAEDSVASAETAPTRAPSPATEPAGEAAPSDGEAAPGAAKSPAGDVVLAEQDYRAAMNEIRSNLEVRRLMLVVVHILVPAFAMAITDCLSGSEYPVALRWLPRGILPVVGATLAVAGILVTGVLTRCHFGLVVNGSKMRRVLTGNIAERPLNWLGVTTNFTALTAFSAGLGATLLLASYASATVAIGVGIALACVLIGWLRVAHGKANRLCRSLESNWQTADISRDLREEHTRLSLEQTSSDISIVVTMGAALFAGTFNSMTNVGGLSDALASDVPIGSLREHGVPVLSAYTLAALLLSGRMVVRLRIALAEHSETLARLRDEPDDPWKVRPFERTLLLFALQHILATSATWIFVASVAGATVGLATAAGVLVVGAAWYPWSVAHAGRRARRARSSE